MMEHYGVAVFGLVLGLFFAFWVWMRDELEVASQNGCKFEGCGRGRYALSLIGFLATLGAMIFCKFVYYP